jgi:hypothetical protein
MTARHEKTALPSRWQAVPLLRDRMTLLAELRHGGSLMITTLVVVCMARRQLRRWRCLAR